MVFFHFNVKTFLMNCIAFNTTALSGKSISNTCESAKDFYLLLFIASLLMNLIENDNRIIIEGQGRSSS